MPTLFISNCVPIHLSVLEYLTFTVLYFVYKIVTLKALKEQKACHLHLHIQSSQATVLI